MPDELTNDEQHSGVTDDALEAAAAALFSSEDEPLGKPVPTTEPPVEEGDLPAPSSTGADTDVWEFDLGNDEKLTINRDQAKAYAEFEAFLAANPELAQAISGTVQGTHKFVPAETPVPEASAAGTPVATPNPLEPPDVLDMDDPVQKAVWERMVATQTKLDETTALIERHELAIRSQVDQGSVALVNRATETFQEAHKLTDEDMLEIKSVAGRLNVLPSLMAPIDPVSGLPRNIDPLKALDDAFDLARWQIPRLREAELAAVQAETRSSNSRKAKLSSLGGSSGSVPRQQNTVPTNPAERRKAMVTEMAAMLNGNWINPEDS